YDRRRRRDPGATRNSAGRRLHASARLSVQPTAAGQRSPADAGAAWPPHARGLTDKASRRSHSCSSFPHSSQRGFFSPKIGASLSVSRLKTADFSQQGFVVDHTGIGVSDSAPSPYQTEIIDEFRRPF